VFTATPRSHGLPHYLPAAILFLRHYPLLTTTPYSARTATTRRALPCCVKTVWLKNVAGLCARRGFLTFATQPQATLTTVLTLLCKQDAYRADANSLSGGAASLPVHMYTFGKAIAVPTTRAVGTSGRQHAALRAPRIRAHCALRAHTTRARTHAAKSTPLHKHPSLVTLLHSATSSSDTAALLGHIPFFRVACLSSSRTVLLAGTCLVAVYLNS